MLLKLRLKLIKMLVGDEPILMNWRINSSLVKGEDASAVYIPLSKDKYPADELSAKAVLTPIRNEI